MEKTGRKKNIIRFLGWMSLALSVGVILLAALTFTNENTSVGTGAVQALNSGWTFTAEEESKEVTLPYFAKSEPYDAVCLSRIVDEELAGKTLAFLSADKTLFITLCGEKIYSYADIPADAVGKELFIMSTSPYSDYAGIWGPVTYGARDDVILHDLRRLFRPLSPS